MFRADINFISTENFLTTLCGNSNFGLGNPNIINKPISVFVDYMADDYKLSLNPYNFLFILEPNELFGLHDWAIYNQNKFTNIFTWSKKILDACPNAYFFPFGVSWLNKDFVEEMETKEKKFEVSYLCGAKKMIEGHYLRHRLYNRGDEITIPKKWFFTLPDYSYQEGRILGDLSQKKVVWEESMFSICVENSSHHGYHTEKIIDAFLSKTIPVYWGCKDIEKFYNADGIIICQDENEIIEKVNKLTPEDYYKRKEAIEENYELAKYYANLYDRMKDLIFEITNLNNIPDSTYHGQHLEDKWIDENLILPNNGTFLDIGACYSTWLSNTYFFEKEKGWKGLIIEPDPIYFADNKVSRTCYMENVAIHPNEGTMNFKPMSNLIEEADEDSITVKCSRLDTVLDKYNIQEIDLISIDIEGYEKEAWSTFDYKKYNPKVMIIEHTEFGKFDRSFADFVLQDSNYYIAHATPLNFIIVHKDIKRK
jgi:FkbM family methyltransferase